ncbi:hypothetical protein OC707_02035 ['Opuntia sp.' phytoplasma]|uniref:Uncharacterized protein n=1 Tax=Candidatus Phytoplasma asiaticum TaxID=2763338 RepID=A0AAX3B9S2_9MOLU|nr:hypothetical protein ['Parthenium hysterophorus' phyllody phytoplasma]MDO8054220.1 hypothetical protein ['Opuntia sp.' phytoplasma]UQV27272.1 hypothetical protein H7686_0000310 ['Parthenium hysterophorus' phyllody phytoplasma]UQV27330.1 hypothetical protein H7686_0000655 ['Parthenium hysterophorus' phyllody phytoplasma]
MVKKGKNETRRNISEERDELEIIWTYKTIVKGLIQYFCLANNLKVLISSKLSS